MSYKFVSEKTAVGNLRFCENDISITHYDACGKECAVCELTAEFRSVIHINPCKCHQSITIVIIYEDYGNMRGTIKHGDLSHDEIKYATCNCEGEITIYGNTVMSDTTIIESDILVKIIEREWKLINAIRNHNN